MGYHAAHARERETVTAADWAERQEPMWLDQLREAVDTQLLAAKIEDAKLTQHLTGNLIYTLRAACEGAYDAGWRQGFKEGR